MPAQLFCRQDMGKAVSQILQGRQVEVCVYRCCAIGNEEYPVIPDKAVPCGGFAAAVRQDAGDNELVDSTGFQDFIETCPEKGAVTILIQNLVCFGRRKSLDELPFAGSVLYAIAPPFGKHPPVLGNVPVTVSGEDDLHACGAAGADRGKDIFDNRRCNRKEKLLHVNDEYGTRLRPGPSLTNIVLRDFL